MLTAVFVDASGRLKRRRLFHAVFACVLLALLSTLLLIAAPAFAGNELVQGIWVLSCVFFMKMPLVMILWWLIWRNKELPGRPVEWSHDELAGILEHLLRQARYAATANDEQARLAYLSGEAWHVADRVGGDAKVDALTVALQIDERLAVVRGSTRPPRG
jgi:hypothetical protein